MRIDPRCWKDELETAQARAKPWNLPKGWTDYRELALPVEQVPEDMLWLLRYLQEQQFHSLLEIGSRTGFMLRAMTVACGRKTKARAIDISNECGLTDIVSDLNKHGYDADCLIADSHSKAAIDWAKHNGSYEFVFIDGDHEYDGVKADWVSYREFGKVVGFHDIVGWDCPGVQRLWKEIKAQGYTTRETHYFDNYMGIGLVMTEGRN